MRLRSMYFGNQFAALIPFPAQFQVRQHNVEINAFSRCPRKKKPPTLLAVGRDFDRIALFLEQATVEQSVVRIIFDHENTDVHSGCSSGGRSLPGRKS